MNDQDFKRQLLSEIARRLIEQWPGDGTTITTEELEHANQPLSAALDGDRMTGEHHSHAGSIITHLRQGIAEAIWYLDLLPLAQVNGVNEAQINDLLGQFDRIFAESDTKKLHDDLEEIISRDTAIVDEYLK